MHQALFIFVSVQIRFLLEPIILLDLHVGSISLLDLLWYRSSSFSDIRVRFKPELTGALPVFNPKDPIEIYSLVVLQFGVSVGPSSTSPSGSRLMS
ncbi:unnamed protein product [Brassica oleracea var. botrytis]